MVEIDEGHYSLVFNLTQQNSYMCMQLNNILLSPFKTK
jgi:hypothetical protein